MNLDPCFLVCRRFGFLRTCVLLDQQDQLQQLEEGLIAHDRQEEGDDRDSRRESRRVDAESDNPRKTLIDEIKKMLKKYGQFVLNRA